MRGARRGRARRRPLRLRGLHVHPARPLPPRSRDARPQPRPDPRAPGDPHPPGAGHAGPSPRGCRRVRRRRARRGRVATGRPTTPTPSARAASAGRGNLVVTPMSGQRPEVVVVGGGFGGLYAARALRDAPVHVTLVDRRNHHLFQPLLYQVATAALNPADIAAPIRACSAGKERRGRARGGGGGRRHAPKKLVARRRRASPTTTSSSRPARPTPYFGHDEWAPFAPGLKSIEDALEIRRRVLLAFEVGRARAGPRAAARVADLRDRRRRARPASSWPARWPRSRARRSPRDFRHIDPDAGARHPARGRAPGPAAPTPPDLSAKAPDAARAARASRSGPGAA